jgi:hypothetical protein
LVRILRAGGNLAAVVCPAGTQGRVHTQGMAYSARGYKMMDASRTHE